MPSAKVTITRFNRSILKLGALTITVLEPAETTVEQIEGDIIEILARVSENEVMQENTAYVVAEIVGMGAKLVYGDTRTRSKEKLLLPRPAKLARVGVVKTSSLKYDSRLGGVVFREEDIEWYTVPREVYVFDPRLEIGEDVAFVILETDLGRTIVKTADLSKFTTIESTEVTLAPSIDEAPSSREK
ncbi:MAG: hypothetical protein QXS85_03625 [Acidilobaceae archaeon]